jgi:hypothetical protein
LNGNGLIDSAKELFGNETDHNLPDPGKRNGFAALAYYDTKDGGGNGDGRIDAKDAVYSKMLVWVDANQNGISEPGELIPLSLTGIDSISLTYTEFRRVDEFGNTFKYKGSVTEGSKKREAVYDVFLVTESALRLRG